MKTNIKMLTMVIGVVASSSAFAATTTPVHSEAGTEIHWDGKVPTEFNDDNVIMTSINGTPLNEALKGGDLYLANDGTFTSSSIPLELHYRVCDSDGAGTMVTDGTDDCAGGSWVTGDVPEAVGDLIVDSDWALLDARYNVGGRENAELSTSAIIEMDGTALVEGAAAVSSTGGRPVFTTTNATPAATAPSAGTKYSVYASIVASNAL
ncbi:hypothetical protein HL669_23690 [Vibrio parahaemolyticus]|uniref:hypothetical protein n=1 Tax=Vibrio parahaemolyticus TaxID=670 RepID=UPI001485A78C|nr:hypothetical protein [Vibrio parahaemolyticus]NNU14597.1 hypothetical protein [Vibrio parahaemolyticus]